MFSRRIQQRVRQIITSIMRPLVRTGITPNILTLAGLLLSTITAVIIAQGWLLAGGLLVLFAGIFDMFDGAMARARNEATLFGAFFDSTLDRFSESIILFGLLWYAVWTPGVHDPLWPFHYEQSWLISLIYVAVVGSLMVSYAKARAEGLGIECKTGLLARPERVVILAIGLISGAVIWALLLLAIFSNVTAIERIVYVRRATARAVTASQAGEFPIDGRAPESGTAPRHMPGETSEGVKPSAQQPVHSSAPPFSGSVQQE